MPKIFNLKSKINHQPFRAQRGHRLFPPVPPRLLWAPPLLWAALIFGISSIPGDELQMPIQFDGMDKLIHAVIYAVLAWLLFLPLTRLHRMTPLRAATIAVFLAAVYGLSDEIHQSFTPRRTTEIADLVANTLGASSIFLWLHFRRCRNRETSL